MGKSDLDCLKDLPGIDKLKPVFGFIENTILLENIAITFQYLVFLINIQKNHTLPGAVEATIYKDMIIHTGSIAESLLYYGLSKGIEKGKCFEKDFKFIEKKYKFPHILHQISDDEVVIGGTRTIKPRKLSEAQFNNLIDIAKRTKLIDSNLEAELDIIRAARNKIHLGVLTNIDDEYTMETVNDMFKSVQKLKKRVEEFLS